MLQKIFLKNNVVVAIASVGSSQREVTYEDSDKHLFADDISTKAEIGDTFNNLGIFVKAENIEESK